MRSCRPALLIVVWVQRPFRLLTASGRPELVTNGTEFIIAYDPSTGQELWRTKGVESNAIHTPLVGHGLVFATAGYPAKKVIALRPASGRTRIASPGTSPAISKGRIYIRGEKHLFAIGK
jgi:outer membrane protein assembly factor BamB